MGYRIMYSPEDNHKYPSKKLGNQWILAAVIIFAILTVSSSARAREKLEHWLIPGDVGITKGAVKMMVDGIRNGESIGEAVAVFCNTIIDNGKTEEHIDA